jgi:hypothetical protein
MNQHLGAAVHGNNVPSRPSAPHFLELTIVSRRSTHSAVEYLIENAGKNDAKKSSNNSDKIIGTNPAEIFIIISLKL